MFLKVLLFSLTAHATPPQFAILGEDEPAPFEGVLFNKRGIAELLVLPEKYRLDCDLEVEYQIDRQATEFHLERQNFQIRLDSLLKEYGLRIDEKDREIAALQDALLAQAPTRKWWWFAGGVAAGVATTYGAYRLFNEQ
jgi:hypothetical protein|tara:strand:- start:79 stop:495 length:417 start_codon:yes stop_codon:yes gene_type:complete